MAEYVPFHEYGKKPPKSDTNLRSVLHTLKCRLKTNYASPQDRNYIFRKPSSSGRSAELLTSSAGLLGGLAAAKTPLFPTLLDTPTDQYLNTDFMICLKRINKKDPITKTKALQELTEMVKTVSVEDVSQILGHWARAFPGLASDTDHRVRGAAQMCHGAIVKSGGRALAPHLKLVAPAWVMGQGDNYPPAAEAAHASLENTFPDNKLPEMLAYCKCEVMTHIVEALLGDIEQRKGESAEGWGERRERAVLGGLQGVRYMVDRLPEALGDWLWDRLGGPLGRPAFWDLARHEAVQIRAAWFAAVGRLVERYGARVGPQYGARVGRELLSGARDHHALLAEPLWTCLAVFVHSVEDWRSRIDEKELADRIVTLLKRGGWGEARALRATLLPLLAGLPEDMLTRPFYDAFFAAMLEGLDKKNIELSKSECEAWLGTMVDCLSRVTRRPDDELAVGLVTAVHGAWLERIQGARPDLVRRSVRAMVGLLGRWGPGGEVAGERRDRLVRNFWQNIYSTITNRIDRLSSDPEEIANRIEEHVLLVRTLKEALRGDGERGPRVRFDTDGEVRTPTPSSAGPHDRRLREAVHRVCSHYFSLARSLGSWSPVVSPLLPSLREHSSRELFAAMADHLDVGSVFGVYDRVLRVWLTDRPEPSAQCEPLVDVVFLLFDHLEEEDQGAVLDSFSGAPSEVMETCVAGCVGRGLGARSSVGDWLRRGAVRGTLLGVAGRLLRGGERDGGDLLLACFTPGESGEIPIGSESAAEILTLFSESLADVGRPHSDRSVSVAARLLSSVADYRPVADPYVRLATRLFGLDLHAQVPSGEGPVLRDAGGSWRRALGTLDPEDRDAFGREAVRLVRAHLDRSSAESDPGRIERAAVLCAHLPSGARVRDVFPRTPGWGGPVKLCALRYDCLTGRLNCPLVDDHELVRRMTATADSDEEDLTRSDLAEFVDECTFRAMYLRNIIVGEAREDGAREDGAPEAVRREYAVLLRDYVVLSSLCDGYAYWPHHELAREATPRLREIIAAIIQGTPPSVGREVLTDLTLRARAEGYHWAYARRMYALASGEEVAGPFTMSGAPEDILSGSGFYHRLQADMQDVPGDGRDVSGDARDVSGDARDVSGDRGDVYKGKVLIMLRCLYLAHADRPRVLEDLLRTKDRDPEPALDPDLALDRVIDTYYNNNHIMLYERDISSATWAEVVSNAATVDALTELVATRGWGASDRHWDFTTITLCSLVASLGLSLHGASCVKVALLARSTLALYCAVDRFVSSVGRECERRVPSPHVAHLPSEWAEVFAPDIHRNLLRVLLHVLDTTSSPMTVGRAVYMEGLQEVASETRWPGPGDLVEACCRVMEAPVHHAYKYLAHTALKAAAGALLREDDRELVSWSERCASGPAPPPALGLARLGPPLCRLQEMVDAVLAPLRVGEDTCTVLPHSDSHSIVMGYLLLQQTLLHTTARARGDLIYHYIQLYTGLECAGPMMNAALRLLPAELMELPVEELPDRCQAMFTEDAALRVREPPVAEDAARAACRCVYLALAGAGAVGARGWWGAVGARVAGRVRALVARYVSPALIREQLTGVQEDTERGPDTELTTRWAAREAVCAHTVDGRRIELTVELSEAHPLLPPRIEVDVSLTDIRWMHLYLSYQSGTVAGAMRLWAVSVDKKVERSPQCYVCYCHLHPANARLPNSTCRQCKNKFHVECITKWFTTSKQHCCPLCRAPF